MRPDISLNFFFVFFCFFGFFSESDVWKGREGKGRQKKRLLVFFLRLLRMPPSLFILLFMNEVYEVPIYIYI